MQRFLVLVVVVAVVACLCGNAYAQVDKTALKAAAVTGEKPGSGGILDTLAATVASIPLAGTPAAEAIKDLSELLDNVMQ